MANEHSQIVPSMQPTSTVADFKFWCQKVLPLVYDDSLSYYEVLNKMVVYLNQVIDNINADTANVTELEDDFLLLQTYVNNFFDDIDQLVTYAERAEAAETAALSSAASAAESATNAASSAVNAATSSGSAATSALSAMDAKDAAVAAKTAAETALANAQTAATNAAASATAASNSATAASGSATNAAASAASALQNFQLSDAARVAAQTAATNAANSANAAAASAASADGAKAQAMIAEEETATATNSHSVGEFFRMNGNLYVATANIQIDDTITVGTNCRAAVVGEELSKLNTAINDSPLKFIYPSIYSPIIRLATGEKPTCIIDHNILDISGSFVRQFIIDTQREQPSASHTIFLPNGNYKFTAYILNKNISASDEDITLYFDCGLTSMNTNTFTRFILVKYIKLNEIVINTPYISDIITIEDGNYDISVYASVSSALQNSTVKLAYVLEKV